MESLTTLIPLLATGSLLAVFGSTLLERLIPILPSYLLLIGIGIATARVDGSLAAMVAASIAGSVGGSAIYFGVASRIDRVRSRRWGLRLGRMCGVTPRRMRQLMVGFRRDASGLSFVSQLVPGLRLLAPAMAGAIGVPAPAYLPYAAAGIAVWNLFFMAAGFLAALGNPQADAAAIAAVVIGTFLGAKIALAAAWWAVRRQRSAARCPAPTRVPATVSAAQAVVR